MSLSLKDRFRAACGLIGSVELELTLPDHSPERLSLVEPYTILGRSTRTTVQLEHDTISRRHLYLQVLGGRLFAVDLESRTGLTLEGSPVRATWLDPQQLLGIGTYTLRRVDHPSLFLTDSNPLEDRLSDPGPISRASFEIQLRQEVLSRWRMNRRLALVGGSTACRVRLQDESVSRIHCSFIATTDGIWVVDLFSREGTRVNREPVRYARLQEGDQVQVGAYLLRISYHRVAGNSMILATPTGLRVSAEDPATPVPVKTQVPTPVSDAGTEPLRPPEIHLPAVVVCESNEHGLMSQIGQDQNLLIPLVQHFNAMQQHMFDQFQQTMMMLVQMMSTIHQDQVALLREELRQFQKATEDLHRLEHELRSRSAAPASVDHAPADHTPAASSSPAPNPEASWPHFWQVDAEVPLPDEPESVVSATVSSPHSSPHDEVKSAEEGDEVHHWLTQRIAQLQSERQSSWQRIMSFIRGQ